MEPSRHEKESRLAAQLLIYALPLAGGGVPQWVIPVAQDLYGDPHRLNELTVMLCSLCRGLSEDDKNRIIYDGRNSDARKLADWWDEHQEADRIREQKERSAA